MISNFLRKVKSFAKSVRDVAEVFIKVVDTYFDIKDSIARILTTNTQLA